MAPAGPVGKDGRRSIAVDFDGVIHSYTSSWVAPHVIPDPPVEGSIEWLWRILQHFDVVILSTRCRTWRGRRAVRRWLLEHAGNLYYEGHGYRGLEEVTITAVKLPCLVYIDDRAYRFTGDNFPSKDEVYAANPWWKS